MELNHHKNPSCSVLHLVLISISGCHSNIGNAPLEREPNTVAGIDVSNHNGSINWKKVSSDDKGIHFVYIKSTEGATYSDPRFLENAKGASAAGLHVGAYHYFRMTSSAQAQFKSFKRALDTVPFALFLWWMWKHETRSQWPSFGIVCLFFFSFLEKASGVHPVIYGTNHSYRELCGNSFDEKHPLCIGRYESSVPVVPGESHYTVWQYSEKGREEGIEKKVDLCRFHPECGIEDLIMPRRVSVEVIEKDGLTYYYPSFEKIDLITKVMPSKMEEAIDCLEKAIDAGHNDFYHYLQDSDLDSIVILRDSNLYGGLYGRQFLKTSSICLTK